MMDLEEDFMAIYDSITGYVCPEYRVPWVKNAWNENTGFAQGYEILHQRRESLAQRLGLTEAADDYDIEDMMSAILNIQEDLCRRMFYCTIRYAMKGYKL